MRRDYIEKIGNVKLNYKYYSNKDLYSDGDDVENELLAVVKEKKITDLDLYESKSYPFYYHMSPNRSNIVDGMNIDGNDDVLEIGAGCGAITGELAKNAKKVTCIELSKRRSLINAYKNNDFSNIEIIVSNYEKVKLKKLYDVITMIGVFEYAALYIHTNQPHKDFLLDAYNRLKPGGRLYIAIENRLGCKYFSGCREDHTGRSFEGIEGYIGEKTIKTLSYFEWKHLLKECEINDYYFMYPYPDYKFPRVIYSDYFLPQKYIYFEPACDYGKKKRRLLFNENDFLNNLCEEEFKIFSNSFLICISKGNV